MTTKARLTRLAMGAPERLAERLGCSYEGKNSSKNL